MKKEVYEMIVTPGAGKPRKLYFESREDAEESIADIMKNEFVLCSGMDRVESVEIADTPIVKDFPGLGKTYEEYGEEYDALGNEDIEFHIWLLEKWLEENKMSLNAGLQQSMEIRGIIGRETIEMQMALMTGLMQKALELCDEMPMQDELS